jgi:hypothetical protein
MFTHPLGRTDYMLSIQHPLLAIGRPSGPANPLEAARMITSSPAAQALIVAGLGAGTEAEALSFYVDWMEALFTAAREELTSLEWFLVKLINSRDVRAAA